MKRQLATDGKAVLRLPSGLQIGIGNLKAKPCTDPTGVGAGRHFR